MGQSIFRIILEKIWALLAFSISNIAANIFEAVSYQELNAETASFTCQRCLKSLAHFPTS